MKWHFWKLLNKLHFTGTIKEMWILLFKWWNFHWKYRLVFIAYFRTNMVIVGLLGPPLWAARFKWSILNKNQRREKSPGTENRISLSLIMWDLPSDPFEGPDPQVRNTVLQDFSLVMEYFTSCAALQLPVSCTITPHIDWAVWCERRFTGPLTLSEAQQTLRIDFLLWGAFAVHGSVNQPQNIKKPFFIFLRSVPVIRSLDGPPRFEWQLNVNADAGRTEWIRERLMSSILAATQPVRRHFPRSDKVPFTRSGRLQSHYSEHNEAQLNGDQWRKNGNVFPPLKEEWTEKGYSERKRACLCSALKDGWRAGANTPRLLYYSSIKAIIHDFCPVNHSSI